MPRPLRCRSSAGRRAGFALALLLAAGGGAASGADPFYLERLEEGSLAYRRGDFTTAAKELRIACFGLLEEPPLLVDCLSRLALTQAGLDDGAAFDQTFRRILEIEDRFSVWAEAALEPELRARLEQEIARRIPARLLQATPAFQHLTPQPTETQTVELTPKELRRALEAELEQGGGPEPLLELARLELEEGRPRKALGWLARLPDDASQAAGCLRRAAATAAADCAALLAAPPCAEVGSGERLLQLECLVKARDWPGALTALEGLPPESRAGTRVARWERKIRSGLEASGDEVGAAPEATAPADESAARAGAPAPEPAPAADEGAEPAATPSSEPTDRTEEELAALRVRLARAHSEEQLRATLADASELADRRPESRPAQMLTAEAAYLVSDWRRTVAYCRRAGLPDESEPQMAFYCAVALFETGERRAAAELLRPALPRLQRSEFVESYVRRILPGEVAFLSAPPGI